MPDRVPGQIQHRRAPAVCRRQGGFTMVELIVVMILIGILGAIGAARFFSRTGFDTAAYAEQSAGMLRYAQKLAIAQNRNVFVQATPQGIRLCYTGATPCGSDQRVPTPAGDNSGTTATRAFCSESSAYVRNWYCEAVPAGVAMTLAPATGGAFYFNALGRPYLAADTGTDSTFAGLALTIAGDGVTRTLTVAQETGYVN